MIILSIVGVILLWWALKPLFTIKEKKEDGLVITNIKTIFKNDTPEIIVKRPYFDVSKIKEYNTTQETKKFIYRPQTLNQYIGQQKAKNLIELNLKKIRELKFVHFLISGRRGCGKTTLAHIIKNSLQAKMIERVAGELTEPDQVIEIINEINSLPDKYITLFIDEIHNLKPSLCECFYPIIEDFSIAGKKVKPFVLIGATTEKNILVNKVSPFVDRFQVQLELEHYTQEEIVTILKQYYNQLYSNLQFNVDNYTIIGGNCKFTPRIAITLLEDNLIEKDLSQVLKFHRIVKDGLTEIDFKILKVLQETNRPMGEEAISQRIGISRADYHIVYEPYLAEYGYIIRGDRGRTISEKGKEILK